MDKLYETVTEEVGWDGASDAKEAMYAMIFMPYPKHDRLRPWLARTISHAEQFNMFGEHFPLQQYEAYNVPSF